MKELDNVDLNDLLDAVKAEADRVEDNFLNELTNCDDESQRVPLFDFEIN